MSENKLFEMLNDLDDDILEQSEKNVKYNKKPVWIKWGAIVAASLLIVAAGFFIAGKLGLFDGINTQDSPKTEVVDIGDNSAKPVKDNTTVFEVTDEDFNYDIDYFYSDVVNNGTSSIDLENYEWVPVYKEQTIPEALKPYTLAYAGLPQVAVRPVLNDFDLDGSGNFDNSESKLFFEADRAWRQLVSEEKEIEGYEYSEGKNALVKFSIKTMAQLLKENKHENRVFSPVNIYIALGMLAETTAGNTRQQILDLLGVPAIEDVRILMKGLYNSAYYDENLKSILASSVWLRDDMDYNQDTMDSLAENYYASSFSGEMGSPEYSEAFRTWLDEQTDGLLKEQIGDMEFKKETLVTLATTVCFCAKWKQEFIKDYTDEGIFHAAAGDVQCDFMHQSTTGPCYRGDKFRAVMKWFYPALGNMMFILPDEGVSVYDLLEDEQVLDFIDKGFDYEQSKSVIINMTMPKFDISSKKDIVEDLKELGVTDAFDKMNADFSPLTDETDNIYLSKVEHGVRVAADEEGVKAAAFTVETIEYGALIPDETVDFVLDRPFMFVIRLGEGLPVFIGIVENP